MQCSPNFKFGRVATQALAFLVAAGLSACNHADGGKDPDGPSPQLPEVSITFGAGGNIIVKDREGKPMGDQCSPDPKSPNVCPIFKPGHKVQVEQAVYVQGIQYHGSPQCLVLLINGSWYVLPSAAACQ